MSRAHTSDASAGGSSDSTSKLCMQIDLCCPPTILPTCCAEDKVEQLEQSLKRALIYLKSKENLVKIQSEHVRKLEEMYKKIMDENKTLNYNNKRSRQDLENLQICMKARCIERSCEDIKSSPHAKTTKDDHYAQLKDLLELQNKKIETLEQEIKHSPVHTLRKEVVALQEKLSTLMQNKNLTKNRQWSNTDSSQVVKSKTYSIIINEEDNEVFSLDDPSTVSIHLEDIEAAECSIDYYKKALRKLRNLLETFALEIEDLRLQKLTFPITFVDDISMTSEKYVALLKNTQDSAQRAQKHADIMHAQYVSAANSLAETEHKLMYCTQEASKKSDEIKGLQEENNRIKDENKRLINEKEDLNKRYISLETKLLEATRELSMKNESLPRFQEKIDALQDEFDVLKSDEFGIGKSQSSKQQVVKKINQIGSQIYELYDTVNDDIVSNLPTDKNTQYINQISIDIDDYDASSSQVYNNKVVDELQQYLKEIRLKLAGCKENVSNDVCRLIHEFIDDFCPGEGSAAIRKELIDCKLHVNELVNHLHDKTRAVEEMQKCVEFQLKLATSRGCIVDGRLSRDSSEKGSKNRKIEALGTELEDHIVQNEKLKYILKQSMQNDWVPSESVLSLLNRMSTQESDLVLQKIDDLEKNNMKLQDEIEVYKTECRDMEGIWKMEKQLKEENKILKFELEEMRTSTENGGLPMKEQSADEAVQKLIDLEAENGRLLQEIEKIKLECIDLEDIRKMEKDLRMEICDLKLELGQLKTSVPKQKERLSSASANENEIESKNRKIATLGAELQEKINENKELSLLLQETVENDGVVDNSKTRSTNSSNKESYAQTEATQNWKQQIRDKNKDIAKKNEEIEKKNMECNELRESLKECRNGKHELERQLLMITNSESDLVLQKIDDLEKNNMKLQGEIEVYKTECRDMEGIWKMEKQLREENKILKFELEEMRTSTENGLLPMKEQSADEAVQKLIDLEAENGRLLQEIEKIKLECIDLQDIRKMEKDLRVEISDLKQELSQLKTSVPKQKERLSSASANENEIESKNRKIATLGAELQEKINENKELSLLLQETVENDGVVNKSETRSTKSSNKGSYTQTEATQNWKQQIRDKNKDIAKKNEEIEKKNMECNELRESLKECRNGKHELERQLLMITNSTNSKQNFLQEIERKNTEIAEKTEELSKKNEELREALENCEKYEQLVNYKLCTSKENAMIDEESENVQSWKQQIDKKNEEIAKKNKEIENANRESNDLRELLNDCRATKLELQQKLEMSEDKCKNLQRELEQKKKQHSHFSCDLKEDKDTNQPDELQCMTLEDNHTDSFKSDIESLKEEIEREKRAYIKQQQALNDCKMHTQELEQQLEHQTDLVMKLKMQIEKQRAQSENRRKCETSCISQNWKEEIERKNEEISEKNKEIIKKNIECNELRDALRDCGDRKRELEKQMQGCQSCCDKENQTTNAEVEANWKQQVETKHEEIVKKNEEIENANKECEEMRNELQHCRIAKIELEREMDMLSISSKDRYGEKQQELEATIKDCSQMRQALRDSKHRNQQLEGFLDEKDHLIVGLESEIHVLEEELEIAKQACGELRQVLNDCSKKELDKQNAIVMQLTKQVEKQQSQLDDFREYTKNREKASVESLASITETLRQKENELNLLNNQLSEKTEQLTKATETNNSLNQKMTSLLDQIDRATLQYEDIKTILAVCRKNKSDLELEREHKNKFITELQKYVDNLKDELQNLREKVSHGDQMAESSLKEISTKSEEIIIKNNEIQHLKNELQNQVTQMNKETENNYYLKEKIANLVEEIERLRLQYDEMHQLFMTSNKHRQDSKTSLTNDSLKSEISGLKMALEHFNSLDTDVRSFVDDYQDFKNDIRTVTKENKELASENAGLKEKLSAESQSCARMSVMATKVCQDRDDLMVKMEEMLKLFENVHGECVGVRNICEEHILATAEIFKRFNVECEHIDFNNLTNSSNNSMQSVKQKLLIIRNATEKVLADKDCIIKNNEEQKLELETLNKYKQETIEILHQYTSNTDSASSTDIKTILQHAEEVEDEFIKLRIAHHELKLSQADFILKEEAMQEEIERLRMTITKISSCINTPDSNSDDKLQIQTLEQSNTKLRREIEDLRDQLRKLQQKSITNISDEAYETQLTHARLKCEEYQNEIDKLKLILEKACSVKVKYYEMLQKYEAQEKRLADYHHVLSENERLKQQFSAVDAKRSVEEISAEYLEYQKKFDLMALLIHQYMMEHNKYKQETDEIRRKLVEQNQKLKCVSQIKCSCRDDDNNVQNGNIESMINTMNMEEEEYDRQNLVINQREMQLTNTINQIQKLKDHLMENTISMQNSIKEQTKSDSLNIQESREEQLIVPQYVCPHRVATGNPPNITPLDHSTECTCDDDIEEQNLESEYHQFMDNIMKSLILKCDEQKTVASSSIQKSSHGSISTSPHTLHEPYKNSPLVVLNQPICMNSRDKLTYSATRVFVISPTEVDGFPSTDANKSNSKTRKSKLSQVKCVLDKNVQSTPAKCKSKIPHMSRKDKTKDRRDSSQPARGSKESKSIGEEKKGKRAASYDPKKLILEKRKKSTEKKSKK